MSRPFRRYCFSLARELKMTVSDLLNKMSSSEISEWMAYDLTLEEGFKEKYDREMKEEAQRKLDAEERARMFRQFFKVRDTNGE